MGVGWFQAKKSDGVQPTARLKREDGKGVVTSEVEIACSIDTIAVGPGWRSSGKSGSAPRKLAGTSTR